MSMTEQKFAILDSFTAKGYGVLINLSNKENWILINKDSKPVYGTGLYKDADGALTEALRWLRKDSKRQGRE